jgi:hypothetical protein
MGGLFSVRPGRLLICSAVGLALAIPISTATLAGVSLQTVFSPFRLLLEHPLIALSAAVAAASAVCVRRSHERLEAFRAKALALIVQTNRRFDAAPNETLVRRRLAEAIAALTGRGVAVSDCDGVLEFRAGKAIGWRGAIEAELMSLVDSAIQSARAPSGVQIVTLGAFHARTDGLNPRIFGAAIWAAPRGSRALVREADHYIALLIEMASAAIVRRRVASRYPTERVGAMAPVSSAVEPAAASGRLITMGRFPAA